MNDERSLTPAEAGMAILNRYTGCFAITTVSQIKGKLERERLETALQLVKLKTPLLNCRIADTLEGFKFKKDGGNKLFLEIIDNSSVQDWQTLVNDHFNSSLEQEKGLIRCFLFPAYLEHDEHLFVTIIHHAIADGLSTIRLHDLTLKYYELLKNHELMFPQLSNHSSSISQTNINRDLQYFLDYIRGASSLVKKKIQEKFYGVKKISPQQFVPIQTRRGAFLTYCLDNQLTQTIIQTSKINQVTVHGVLCAAILLAIAQSINLNQPKSINLSCQSYVDLRKRLSPAISDEQLGLIISFIISFHKITPQTSLLNLAKEVNLKLQKELKKGDFFHYPLLFKKLIQSSLINPPEATPTVVVTNLGKLNIQQYYADLEVKNICFLPRNALYNNCLVLATSTFNNKMTLNFSFSTPSFSYQKIKSIAKNMIALLSNTLQ